MYMYMYVRDQSKTKLSVKQAVLKPRQRYLKNALMVQKALKPSKWVSGFKSVPTCTWNCAVIESRQYALCIVPTHTQPDGKTEFSSTIHRSPDRGHGRMERSRSPFSEQEKTIMMRETRKSRSRWKEILRNPHFQEQVLLHVNNVRKLDALRTNILIYSLGSTSPCLRILIVREGEGKIPCPLYGIAANFRSTKFSRFSMIDLQP